jgi:membrane peptidoglycan carboxypeptidase
LKTPGAGLTTITQSLVKIFYFDQFKPGLAKFKQTLIARYALDPLVSKDDQLTLFINYIYLGNVNGKAAIGLENAARAYYRKTLDQLSEEQYLSIIAMIIAPQNFHILDRPAANAERTRRLKQVMVGEYRPKELMDIYYGELAPETQKGLAPASYFPSQYRKK